MTESSPFDPNLPSNQTNQPAPRPVLWRPPILFATWFGVGWLPVAPGTWGSLASIPFAWFIHLNWGPDGLMFGAMIVFTGGIWASEIYAREVNTRDPSQVVIDEVAGQWLTLALAAPLDPIFYALGFVLFRFMDIVKPWPVNWADKILHGGFGIMLDDMIAALYAGVALMGIGYIFGVYG
ncbi:MAG: hypothetical protein CBB68_04590 [Rhodospirillaceae bacterium TMED8]|nr:phosphatidylglycerophosphatase A [Magnetovibrio sp.]OUT51721.1 MAG: hypothetical protein CBB68_04590 [Rhodospirillaceae bacterium TMED8]